MRGYKFHGHVFSCINRLQNLSSSLLQFYILPIGVPGGAFSAYQVPVNPKLKTDITYIYLFSVSKVNQTHFFSFKMTKINILLLFPQTELLSSSTISIKSVFAPF